MVKGSFGPLTREAKQFNASQKMAIFASWNTAGFILKVVGFLRIPLWTSVPYIINGYIIGGLWRTFIFRTLSLQSSKQRREERRERERERDEEKYISM